jgi:poly(3-hydroxybutyrate) depolymerase
LYKYLFNIKLQHSMRTTMKTLALAVCAQLLLAAAFAQQVAKTIPNAVSPDGRIGFLEFRPSDYGTQKHPLIIFLHGIGERGNGTTQINSVTNNAIPKFCANGATMQFTVGGVTSSFVVLSPQLSVQYGYWPPFYIREMIKYAKANLQIDTNRIYLTGLSLGGGGIWRAITDASGFDYTFDAGIAAAAPVCGTQEETDADFYGTIGANHLPVWAFHAMDDGTVGVGATQHAEVLGNIVGVNNPAIKFTYYQSGGHAGAWINAYDTGHITRTVNGGGSFTANPNLYEWFLSKTRAVNTVPLANAGTNQSVTLPLNTVTLNGSGAGTNGASISSIAWTKLSGPAGETITAPASASTSVNGLAQGIYVFVLTVTDNHGLTASSQVTVQVVAAPVAIPGPPQTITATSTVLDAAGSYSPNGSITAYSWQQVSGPVATIINANSATPLVSNMVLGSSYSFELTVTDVAGASGSAVTAVTVLNATLPVTFVYFKGQASGNGNQLSWATATELNNDYFAVERSTDGVRFETIGRIAGAVNSNSTVQYSYTDTRNLPGNCYYRLKQVDKDGRFIFSKMVVISSARGQAQVYPNPVQAVLSIAISSDVKGSGKITLFDAAGHAVRTQAVNKTDKTIQEAVNMQALTPGLYTVEVQIGSSFRLTKTVLKQ